MKINIDRSLVEFHPENADETAKLEVIWRMMIDCAGISKKMVPVGEFFPQINKNVASFMIEGLELGKQDFTEVRVESDCRCYCETCNNMIDLKKGDTIPLCCGKVMEVVE